MTKDRIVAFCRELATLIKEAREREAFLDATKARLELASATKDTKAVEQLTSQRVAVTPQYEQAVALACRRANRSDLASCERLLGQLDARLGELENYEKALYAMEAQFEMAVAMNEFADTAEGTTRKEVEAVLTEARERVDKQRALAADLVPDKPVILSL